MVNLITNSSFETNVNDWTTNGCTFVRDVTQAYDGSASGKATFSGGSFSHIRTNPTTLIAALPGNVYTGRAFVKADSTSKIFRILIEFYNSSSVSLGSTNGGNTSDNSSTWTEVVFTSIVAPSTTAYVKMYVIVENGASDIHYIDNVILETRSLASVVQCDKAALVRANYW